jgi:SPP1 gp7 family putative phage head morphogenesis protein
MIPLLEAKPGRPRTSLLQERLAARFHQRQVQLLQAVQQAAVAIRRRYRSLAGPIAELASRVGLVGLASLRRRIEQLLGQARQALQDQLIPLGLLGYRTAGQAVLDALPAEWLPVFAGLAAAKAKLPVREATVPEPQQPAWQVRYDWEPIVRGAIRGQKAKEFVQSLLFPPPKEEQVTDWLISAPPGGLSWQERLRRWEEPVRQAMFNDLVHGLVAGENVDGLRARLERWTDGLAYKAQRIARTEGCRVAERAGRSAFQGMGGMLQGLQIVAVMDEWTRPHHAARNGRIYWQGPDGLYRDERGELLPDLPDEPNCRCMTIPVLRPPPEWAQNPAAMAAFQTATGQLIPDPASYQQWWQQASEREQMTAVGVRRWQTVRDLLQKEPIPRKPEWADFIDPEGRLLPIETLQAETPQERAERLAKVDLRIAQRKALFQAVASTGIPTPLQPGHPAHLFFQGPEAMEREIQRMVQEYQKKFALSPEEKSRRRHFDRRAQKQILSASEVREELLRRADAAERALKAARRPWLEIDWPPHYQRELHKALYEIETRCKQQAREDIVRTMMLPPKYRTRFKVEGTFQEDIGKAANEASRFVGAITNKTKVAQKKVIIEENPRLVPGGGAYYPRQGKVAYHGTTSADTFAHELGHHLQYWIPGLNETALKWGKKVTRGSCKIDSGRVDSMRKRWSYLQRTDGRKWLSDYMGRVDDDDQMWEIVSEGIEFLFKEPEKVAREDPELFELLLTGIR